MARLIVTREIKDEIEALKHRDIDAAAQALLLLQELAGDQAKLEDLCVEHNHYLYDPPFEVKVLQNARKLGLNIYILKYREDDGSLPGYRILVGFDAQRSTYYALALADRNTSYDQGSAAFRELRARYDKYSIPIYR
ncbi:hypothetical protein [Hydrogenophaga sp.]|uniref:hypothetical protein n=1 Tax=Hydrogenophaga sp. TaxID=1904254 RepID=UPI003F7304EA